MNIEPQEGEPGEPAAVPAALAARGRARRRFGKAGIGASGVLLTLASQPGMACEVCRTPSGSLSGGLTSQHGLAPSACNGVSPGYWKNHGGWPSQCDPSTRFSSVFSCKGLNLNTYGSPTTTFGLMLTHQSFDPANLGMHLVATYLNIMSGRIGFLTVPALQRIWLDWQRYGYYSPAAGVNWDAAAIVVYLTRTMD